MGKLIICTLMLLIGLPVSAARADAGRVAIETAKAKIVMGDIAGARQLLDRQLATNPRDVEALFLLGMAAMGEQDYRQAVVRFRQALVFAPNASRVRLELARAFYLDKDYENAFRQFQRARAGNPPAGVVVVIDRYMAAIRQEKSWSYEFGIALAPDTNINNATSAREAEIFGLPFELGEDARRKSGIGLNLGARAEYSPRVAHRTRLRLGAAIQRREYGSGAFDDMVVAVHAGPRATAGRWDISLLGTGFRRWYGGKRYEEGHGARIEAIHYADARSAVTLGLSAQEIRNRRAPLQSGRSYLVATGAIRALTPASSASLRAGIERQEARARDLASWSWFGSAGYQRDLPGGFSVQAEPRFVYSRFDAADPFFGLRRKDTHLELQLTLLNRRIVLSRFTPRISYTYARRRSSIDIYSFTQNRMQVGITSIF